MSRAALRRLIHAATAAVLVIHPLVSLVAFRATVTGVALVVVAIDVARLMRPQFDTWLRGVVPVFRPHEARRLSGATWLWIGYTIAAWLPGRGAVAGIAVAALADPAAAFVGGRWGAPAKKTWPGSAALFGVAIVVLGALRLAWPSVLLAGVAATIVERWPGRFDDNVLIPPAVAAVVSISA